MTNPLNVAVVGAGIGIRHMVAWKALPDQFALAAVVDVSEKRREQSANLFEIPKALESFDALLDDPDIHIIDICTPPHLHKEMIEKGLQAGKHVVCEKPLVGSLAECDAIAAIAKDAKGLMMPIFQYRFGVGLQKLKHMRDKGALGKCYFTSIETAWTRGADYFAVDWRGKWKTERGGALLSQAIHNHDMLTYIVGKPTRIFAHTATRVNPIETEDCAAVSLQMDDGSIATFSVTLGAAVELSRLRYCFETLTAESSLDPYTPSADPWTFSPTSDEAKATIDDALADFTPGQEEYEGQFERFHAAITSGTELPVTMDDARDSLELVTAMYKSSQTGEAVTLPISSDDPWYSNWLPEQYREDG